MADNVELEVCANCKREIPHYNYVMHTAHCARNITLCGTCKEPIPKNEFQQHAKTCVPKAKPIVKPTVPPTKIEQSSYFTARKEIEDKKSQQRQEKRMERLEKFTNIGETVGHSKAKEPPGKRPPPPKDLLPCQYCEIELPKFELGEHEDYCGARTEKCQDCGENVMFKYRQLHLDSNHGYVGSGTRPAPQTSRRPVPLTALMTDLDFPIYSSHPPGRSMLSTTSSTGEKLETSREISRRLDCKTEYIRNLLHDSASITAPIRSTGAVPRYRARRNPPTALVIPCEFCGTPIPHEELIEHETGCRPDLARYNQRREIDDMSFLLSPEPGSPDVELPCEFCSDLIPASQLLSHQAACN
ncbi:hypothetical protein PPYR_03235 [Photinus pyralis]|uniref:TRAFD1/XAF1 zinc finger domain-containing protein n=2 Tax=Photinus pyralis TaxID=7054 RepID=A0A5N4A279_PHOPY|nr:TRAF-type zinc finger domain-containing protein 1-like [Photinus pyralis]XP_031331421.1 TRAF-type zinc finger domain-containing protein 1-like [Photinus pyralis]XP_031331422.1 TRAF-type zinc finger domain-containing protein 1-like [Photinus pyralis]KAB0791435.1 hypothetical protein PPYR_03235 [Photinus pyralis]